MKWKHVQAVFLAEYYTTTYRFKQRRKLIPAAFILLILLFGYILRALFDVLRGDQTFVVPSITILFSLLSLFSYFTLFAPLLTLRVIYDDDAKSRREVALSSPVESRDMLSGNLLSNLAFYLPFFGFLGTLLLVPFIGNGIYSPSVTTILLFLVMSLLILIGLISGTLLSPIIFSTISRQRGDFAKAFVTLLISLMLIVSLPLLRYIMDNSEVGSDINFISILPFTIAASLIIHILYGVQIGVSPILGVFLLVLYISIIIIAGWRKANTLYNLSEDAIKIQTINSFSKKEKFLRATTFFLPKSFRELTRSMIRSSLRDIEHLSRLSIGLAVTIFMVFALSSQGLFRGSTQFSEAIELAVVIFSLVLSAASVIFIEASTFTIQHRDIYTLIKSSPGGAQKFILAKIAQMLYITLPMFISLLFMLSSFGLISDTNRGYTIILIGFILFAMISETLAIYMVNPSDNPEDLSNFINLLFFYAISFALATIPVIITVIQGEISISFLAIYSVVLVITSYISIVIAIKALDEMNLETLSSEFSGSILQILKTFVAFLFIWNFIPLLTLPYLINSGDILGFTIISGLSSMVIAIILWSIAKLTPPKFTLNSQSIRDILISLPIMLGIALILSELFPVSTAVNISLPFSDSTFSAGTLVVLVTLVIVEEVIFRGYLYEFSLTKLNWQGVVTLTSILFAINHLIFFLSFVNALFQGLILGYLRHKHSILTSIITHILYNVTLFIILL